MSPAQPSHESTPRVTQVITPKIRHVAKYLICLIPFAVSAIEVVPLPGALHIESAGWRAICWQVVNGQPGTYLCQPVSGPKTVCHISPDSSRIRCEPLLDRSQPADEIAT